MSKTLHELIQEYLETITTNNEWLKNELSTLNLKTDPTMTKAAELKWRTDQQLRRVDETKKLLSSLETLFVVLGIDSDKVIVED